jgi:outer membrane protein OmpA-like peptidoglycan-associated protein
VRKYLVDKGINEDRLRAVGYGPDKPVDPAKTAAARAKNRRVEFQLIQQ